jgi:hypothetical protein
MTQRPHIFTETSWLSACLAPKQGRRVRAEADPDSLGERGLTPPTGTGFFAEAVAMKEFASSVRRTDPASGACAQIGIFTPDVKEH